MTKANLLNEQFQSVFSHMDESNIPTLDENYPNINNIKIGTEGVKKLLQKLNTKKAAGPDNLPNHVLKELASEIAPILKAIFEQSLQTGELPSDWRNANITPLFKKGNRNVAANYRPISLTSVCCKLMEHIVCKHIMCHL